MSDNNNKNNNSSYMELITGTPKSTTSTTNSETKNSLVTYIQGSIESSTASKWNK